MSSGGTVVFGQEWARSQRQSDEVTVGTGARRHFAEVLEHVTRSFGRPISVLDVGCGTGRFFYCLRHVQSLLALDVSPHMLAEARTPVRAEAIDIGHIELLCADILEIDLSPRRFDLIYSIGVLGESAPLTPRLCEKLHAWLQPEGKLFFTIVDVQSRFDREKCGHRISRGIGGRMFRPAPNWMRRGLNRCVSSFYMTKAQVQKCLRDGGVDRYELSTYRHPPESGWQGTHWECLVVRGAQP